MMKIEQTSYSPNFRGSIITLYRSIDDFVFELCEDGKIMNTTLNNFTLDELKEIKSFIEKAIKYEEEWKELGVDE